jgi:hypothetical protein
MLLLKCKKCERELPEENFRKDSKWYKNRNGRISICKECEYGHIPQTLKLKYATTKVCLECKEEKPIEAFGYTKKPYRNSYCKTCKNKKREANGRINGRNKKRDTYKRMKKFGISVEEYNGMLEEQNNKCEICGIHIEDYKNSSKIPRNFAVDHNHITGEVRGLLCSNCNTALGSFKENLEALQKAIDYLVRYNKE